MTVTIEKTKDFEYAYTTTPSGARIITTQDVPPQELAMLQALTSRSSDTFEGHISKVVKNGPQDFLERVVIGYGDDSVADCAAVPIFFERISLLAAKAIQDNPLFAGIETSTRYLDMQRAPIVTENETDSENAAWWQRFYSSTLHRLIDEFSSKYKRPENVSEVVYENTIKAKAFDVARGFLPAGVCTNTTWFTNLRQFNERLPYLLTHPLREVQMLGESAWALMKTRYPALVKEMPSKEHLDAFAAMRALAAGYIPEVSERPICRAHAPQGYDQAGAERIKRIAEECALIRKGKNKRVAIPREMGALMSVVMVGRIDFGGFRDLQRHRNRLPAMPLLTPMLGMHEYYLEHLLKHDRSTVQHALLQQKNVWKSGFDSSHVVFDAQLTSGVSSVGAPLVGTPLEVRGVSTSERAGMYARQYALPIGLLVPHYAELPLDSYAHLVRLRSATDVHPTVREYVRFGYCSLGEAIRSLIPIKYGDPEISYGRGTQTVQVV